MKKPVCFDKEFQDLVPQMTDYLFSETDEDIRDFRMLELGDILERTLDKACADLKAREVVINDVQFDELEDLHHFFFAQPVVILVVTGNPEAGYKEFIEIVFSRIGNRIYVDYQ